ncbi:hypothetical protein GCM10023190_22790 [Enteractinococcus fodinae]|uniref:Uncharacterized protein n=1 Tax=Enteractinococcus fodinae TaxID=684663 RepID=A0ABU2B306_9MICC|nr:hypothetical protein [Enteractinococcus fodinae]MDR7347961.1 hypothetical protein [Enteractinococcus fodinae]
MASWKPINPDIATRAAYLEDTLNTQIAFAPKQVREVWTQWNNYDSTEERRKNKSAVRVIEEQLESCLDELTISLEGVSPEAATWLLPGERGGEYMSLRGGEHFNGSMCAWLIGVFGSGRADNLVSAHKVFSKYARWVATYLTRWLMLYDLREEEHLGERIVITRLLKVDTKLRWIADEVCAKLGEWVDLNLPASSNALGLSIMRTVEDNVLGTTLSYAADAANDTPPNANHTLDSGGSRGTEPSASFKPLSDGFLARLPAETLEALSAPSRALTRAELLRALEGEEYVIKPLVRVEGSYKVLNRYSWMYSRDVAIMHAIMLVCKPEEVGRPLEETTVALLRDWGPEGFTWESDVVLAAAGRTKGDEVDLFGLSSEVALIGECKANRMPRNNASLDATFEERLIGKAVDQVERRIMNWNSGGRPVNSHTRWVPAVGAVITISSYAGAVWSSTSLVKENKQLDVAIFPLHSFLLMASVLENSSEFRAYIEWRTQLLASGVMNNDELEFLVTFLKHPNPLPAPEQHGYPKILEQIEVDSDAAFLLTPKKNRLTDAWRNSYKKELLESVVSVGPRLS